MSCSACQLLLNIIVDLKKAYESGPTGTFCCSFALLYFWLNFQSPTSLDGGVQDDSLQLTTEKPRKMEGPTGDSSDGGLSQDGLYAITFIASFLAGALIAGVGIVGIVFHKSYRK